MKSEPARPLETNIGAPIGVFDSGYGGLTILNRLRQRLPQADFLYLGDNARAPYGTRSFDLVYQFTLQAVKYLFSRGCRLVIIACNTASAKALRSIQQHDLPLIDPARRVLGVIRPTAEVVGNYSKTNKIGLLATPGTVASQSYNMELAKLFPRAALFAHACPMWVPIIENMEAQGPGADYFVKKDIGLLFEQDADIDTVILGCTHYPLLLNKIRQYMPPGVTLLDQGAIVAEALIDYLGRHPEIDSQISRRGIVEYLTTENADKFAAMATLFTGTPATARRIELS